MSLCPHLSSYKDTSHIELEPILKTLISVIYLFKDLISKHSHVHRHWELGLQRGHSLSHNTFQMILRVWLSLSSPDFLSLASLCSLRALSLSNIQHTGTSSPLTLHLRWSTDLPTAGGACCRRHRVSSPLLGTLLGLHLSLTQTSSGSPAD